MQDDLIRQLHASPWRGSIAITGGGSGAIEQLLATPGASSTVLEATVPYSLAALSEWLGREPHRACDPTTAQAMAMRAWERSISLDEPGSDRHLLFGAACTASLATDRPKRGEHRAFVAVQTLQATTVLELRFEKERRSRSEEEQAVAHTIVAMIGHATGQKSIDLTKTPPGIETSLEEETPPVEWGEVLLKTKPIVALQGAPLSGEEPVCLFPGSFNPPHVGHEKIARIAAEITGRRVVYELSLTNVDKPTLDYREIRRRLKLLGNHPIWLTTAATFIEKAQLSPNTVFAVGADTIDRIARSKYYGSSTILRDQAMGRLADTGAKFLVFGRRLGDRFGEIKSLDLPPALRVLCEGVSEDEFRVDISSSEIRQS